MSVIVTTPLPDGDVRHHSAVAYDVHDDGRLEVLAPSVNFEDQDIIVGTYLPGAWIRARVETEAARREATAEELAAMRPGMWLIPDPGPLDQFPSPVDLQPHIDALQTMAKEMAKIADLGGEARKAYQLQQVAVALWLRLDPAHVSEMRFDTDGHGRYDVIDYSAEAGAGVPRPGRADSTLQVNAAGSFDDGWMRFKVTIADPAAGEALWKLVGAPVVRPFPTFGQVRV